MARKTEYGRYIISASEVGAYTVCPEAWRLASVVKVKSLASENIKKGLDLHKAWTHSYEEALYFGRAGRALFLLLIVSIIFYFLTAKPG